MRSDEYGDWPEARRGRRARRDPDADYGSEPEPGTRDVQEWAEDQPWTTGPGRYPGPDPYPAPRDYGDQGWTPGPDSHGRTDPHGSYYGGPPYEPRAEYPGQPAVPPRDYPSQPPVPRGDYPSQPTFPPGDYPSQPVPRGAYPSQPPVPRGAYPSQSTVPPGGYPSLPPVPRGDYPSQSTVPPGGHPSLPPVPRGDYPGQPPYPAGGSGHGGYDQGYDERYAGRPGYARPGYEPGPGYDSQAPYSGRAAFGEPEAFNGQDAYRDQAGYGAGAYTADNGYGDDAARYGQDYDGFGARSGPLPEFADDDQASWQARGDGAGATRARGAGHGHAARRGRRTPAYQQEDVGHDGPLGGSRGSGRSMDADDDRHSGFFAGYASNDDDHYGSQRKPRRGRGRAAGLIALIIVVVLLGGLGLTGYHFYSQYKNAHKSYSGAGAGSADVIVQPGATAVSIAPELVRLGVIAAVDPFVAYVNTSKNPTGLHPGQFRVHKHMGNPQAWAMLTDSKNQVNSTVTIPDGLPTSKILPLLAKKSHLPLSDFQAAIKETSKLGLPSWASGNPEGFLYPATYDVVPGSTTALQILQTAVHQFIVEIGQVNLAATAQKDQFTELQVVTEASLLEGEVGPKYYADVARTIDNRLKIGMKLQLDSTVAYATGHYTYNLSAKDRQFPSPYNTFLHADLPPGPINSPSLAAIKAVLRPASPGNTWIYFITVNKAGLTEFTSSYSQFVNWSNEATHNGV